MPSTARPRGAEVPPLTPAHLPALQGALGHADPAQRGYALRELRRVVPFTAVAPALGAVLGLLEDADAGVRAEAVTTVACFGVEPQILAALAVALADPEPHVQQTAAGLLPPDAAALPLLRTALTSKHREVRLRATHTLRRFQRLDPAVLALLTGALEDSDRGVRTAAAQAALAVGVGRAELAPALTAAVKRESDGLTCAFLMRALEVTGGAALGELPFFAALLATAPEEGTRLACAQVLGAWGAAGHAALPALRAAVTGDGAALVRGYAAQALGKLGPVASVAIPTLIAMVEDRATLNYRAMAVTALAAIDAERRADVTRALAAALGDAEAETQACALQAVAHRGPPSDEVSQALQALQLAPGARNANAYLATMAALGLSAGLAAPADEAAQWAAALGDRDVHVRAATLLRIRGAAAIDARWIAPLARILAEEDRGLRRSAAELLRRAGPAARPALGALTAALLDSDDGGVEREVAHALGQLGPAEPEVLAALTAHLARGASFRADASAMALASMGAAGVDALVEGVRSRRPYACFAAAQALATLGPLAAQAVPALLELWVDPARLTVRLTDGAGSSREAVRAALLAIAPADTHVRRALNREEPPG